MDVRSLLVSFEGCARREALLAAGCTWEDIERALAIGQISRRHRGVYALAGAPVEVVTARVFRAQISCLSACARWGLPLLNAPAVPHLVVPRSRSQSRPGRRGEWAAVIHRSDTYETSDPWARPRVALDQMADCTSPLDQLIAIDGALHTGLIFMADLAQFSCGTQARREWLVARASALADSLLETITRVVLAEAGFPATPQRFVDRVGHTDFELEDGSVVEADGYAHHSSRKAFREDRRRGRELQLQNRRELHFTFEDVVHNPIGIAQDVGRLLGRPMDPGFIPRWRQITAPTGMRTANPANSAAAPFNRRRS